MLSKKQYRQAKNTTKKAVGFVKKYHKPIMTAAGVAYQAYKVAQLAAMINAEKKRINSSLQTVAFASLNGGTGSGFYAADITPNPAEGLTSATRNGNSIKLTSSYYKFQVRQQSAVDGPMKYKVVILAQKGASNASVGTYPSTILNPNPFLTGASIYDYNSSYNPDYFSQFEIIKTINRTILPDQLTAMTQIDTFEFGLKYNKDKGRHIRFTSDGAISTSAGQLIIMVLADSGNMSASTPSTIAGAPVVAINTGAYISMDCIHYYYDN